MTEQQQQPKTAGVAIASLVLGICSLICAVVTAIPAVICGHIALSRIKQSGGTLQGRGLALAGLITGYAFLAISMLAILAGALFPAVMQATQQAQATAIQEKGRAVWISLVSANTEREMLGLAPIWPQSETYATSTEFFKRLSETKDAEIDYAMLAGAGVPVCTTSDLTAENNMWAVLASLTAEDDDSLPLLVTRNVNVQALEREINDGITADEFSKRIAVGQGRYTTPLGSQRAVIVTKGGRVLNIRAHALTLGYLTDNREVPPRDGSKTRLVYLLP